MINITKLRIGKLWRRVLGRSRVMGIAILGTGIILGSYLTLSKVIIPWVKALTETTTSMPADVAFNAAGYNDGSGAVSVLSEEIRIATSSAWLSGSYAAKKTITLNNLSGQNLEASGSAQITVNTKELFDAGKLQADCDDLRVVHVATVSANIRTEIPRSYQPVSGATNCSDSTATIVTFPRQEKLWVGQSSGNYEVYYADSAASAPSYPKEKYLSFGGDGDVVTVTDNDAVDPGLSDFSFEFWFKPAVDNGSHAFVEKRLNNGYILYTSGATWIYGLYSDSGVLTGGNFSQPTIANNWYHVVMNIDRDSNITFYINGVLVETEVISSAQSWNLNNATNLSIGSWTTNRMTNGVMDEFVMRKRILSETEISDHYRTGRKIAPSVNDTNISLLLHLDEGQGQTTVDFSGNNLTAILGSTAGVDSYDPAWIMSGITGSGSIANKNLTLFCPFAGSTTCLGGQTAATSTGAIRYSGGKSALSFDGISDYVDLSTANLSSVITYSGTYTIEAWVNPDSSSHAGSVFGWANNGSDRNGIIISAGGVRAGYYNGTSYTRISGNITSGSWHHIVYINEAGSLRLFIDNVEQTGTTSPSLGGSDKRIGHQSNAGYYLGLIDEVAVYNRALSLPEISSHYNGGVGTVIKPDSSTKLLYHFDENGDDPRNSGKVIDISGNGNHGTITGAKFVSGLEGVDSSTSETGVLPTQSYAGHQGVFVEDGTTNLVSNPSFENATFNSLWGPSAFTYATSSATFTPNVSKRNSAGPFAAGPMISGKLDGVGEGDALSSANFTQISGDFYNYLDGNQGSIVFWITPEWNGNDGILHRIPERNI